MSNDEKRNNHDSHGNNFQGADCTKADFRIASKTAEVFFGQLAGDQHTIRITSSNADGRIIDHTEVIVPSDEWDSYFGFSDAEIVESILGWENTEHDRGIVHMTPVTPSK